MTKKPRSQSVLRLFVFSLMIGGLLISYSGEKASGSLTEENCGYSFHTCLDGCAPGPAGDACRLQCHGGYDHCIVESGQPWPIVDFSFTSCLQGCNEACGAIEDPFERFYCINPCNDWCYATYPKP